MREWTSLALGEKDFKVQKVFRAKVPTNEWSQRYFEIVATRHEIQWKSLDAHIHVALLVGSGFSLILDIYISSGHQALTDWYMCGWMIPHPQLLWKDHSGLWSPCFVALCQVLCMWGGTGEFINTFCLKSLLKRDPCSTKKVDIKTPINIFFYISNSREVVQEQHSV